MQRMGEQSSLNVIAIPLEEREKSRRDPIRRDNPLDPREIASSPDKERRGPRNDLTTQYAPSSKFFLPFKRNSVTFFRASLAEKLS